MYPDNAEEARKADQAARRILANIEAKKEQKALALKMKEEMNKPMPKREKE